MPKGARGTKSGGGRTSKSNIQTIVENRPPIDTKTYNTMKKEIEAAVLKAGGLHPTFKKGQLSVGTGFTESYVHNDGTNKQVMVTVDTGARYTSQDTKSLQQAAFSVLEKYNKEYKFDYLVDRKKFKSDLTNFKNISSSVYELF